MIGASLCVMALSAGVWLALVAVQAVLTPKALRRDRVIEIVEPRKEVL